MVHSLGFLLFGIVLLAIGAHFLIKGATAMALHLRVTPAVIGLTVVAIGTSLPELFVGLAAHAANQPELLVGNLIGSNILNIALVLGLSSVCLPIAISKLSIRREWPIMFFLTLLVGLFLLNLNLARWESLLLLVGTILSTVYFVWLGRKTHAPSIEEETHEVLELKKKLQTENRLFSILKYTIELIFGFLALRLGSRFFIDGATQLATIWGISNRVIGITVVAFGTSLPELAVSLVATARGRSDVAVGNIIGSNIFNLAGVLGICGLLGPFSLSRPTLTHDFPWLIGISVLLFVFMITGKKIGRWKGALFLLTYGFFAATLF